MRVTKVRLLSLKGVPLEHAQNVLRSAVVYKKDEKFVLKAADALPLEVIVKGSFLSLLEHSWNLEEVDDANPRLTAAEGLFEKDKTRTDVLEEVFASPPKKEKVVRKLSRKARRRAARRRTAPPPPLPKDSFYGFWPNEPQKGLPLDIGTVMGLALMAFMYGIVVAMVIQSQGCVG